MKRFYGFLLLFVCAAGGLGVYAPQTFAVEAEETPQESALAPAEGEAAAGKAESFPARKSSKGAQDEEESEVVTLRPGDRVFIKVYPEDEYIKGGEMEISSEGNITLSLVGKVNVAGMTIADAEKKIAQMIDADYIVNAEVVIELKKDEKAAELSTDNVVVLGEVRKPGTYPLPADHTKFTLLRAISLAGGFTDIANVKRVKIVRKVQGKKESMQVNVEDIFNGNAPDVELKNGDVINVPESLF